MFILLDLYKGSNFWMQEEAIKMEKTALACPLVRGERILVALDGSKDSEAALDQAISMAKICNSTLFMISVIELYPEQLEVAPALEEKMSTETWEILDRAGERAKKEKIPCEAIVHIGGHPHKFIVQEAKEKNIDLIVMGTHGRTGLKKLLMGSVAERVIGHAPCAVLVSPASRRD
jgi:nucleotide-binding universal stress UspA family protein